MKRLSHALIVICLGLISWKTISSKTEVPEFSPTTLMKTLKDSGIVFPDIVWSQSALETGYWESKVFSENNNLFGMKQARVRENTATGTKYGHATYDDWIQSVVDYKLWQKNHRIDSTTSRESYFKLLSKVYCKTAGYVKAVKKLIPRAQELEADVSSYEDMAKKSL